jgi:hypothetical protein
MCQEGDDRVPHSRAGARIVPGLERTAGRPAAALIARPAGGGAVRSRVAGQVASAAAATIEDLFGQTSTAGGGYWSEQAAGFVLHGMIDVPGVALSGAIHVSSSPTGLPLISVHLTVHGRLAGILALHGLTLSGRVGGARVHTRLAAL